VTCSEWCDDQVKLRFLNDRPFALCATEEINTARLTADLAQLKAHLALSQGDVLICCKGRYAFSIALLATWQAGRQAVLPPNAHQATLEHIIDNHSIKTRLDDVFFTSLPVHQALLEQGFLEFTFNTQQPALIIYTSGSSGEPKAVKKNIGNLFSEVFALQTLFPISTRPLVASVPPNHLYGLTFSILLPWVMGVAVVDECPLHASEVLDTMSQINANTLITVPVHLRALLEQNITCIANRVISSAGSLDEALAQQWYERYGYEVTEVYGSSETGIIAHRQQLSDTLWQSFPNVCLDEFSGCLQVSSPFIHASEGLAFQSQDRVSLQKNGFILHGRADSIVKIAGKRISLLAVEAAMKACDGVMDAAVVAVPVKGHIRDMAIWGAVAFKEGPITGRDIRVMLQLKLDSVEIPRRIVVQKMLPREENGKLRKSELLALFDRVE